MEKPGLLFISNLFPDAAQPYRGLDNATLLHHLAPIWDIRVLSPRPALTPFPPKLLSRPEDESFQPIYPPARYLPKIGSAVNHWLMSKAVLHGLRKLPASFQPRVILASWLYPDACGAAIAAAKHCIPFVAIAQGSDVHQYLLNPVRRRLMLKYLSRAGAIITRSDDLREQLRAAGLPPGKLETIYNGVDLQTFAPGNRAEVRRKLAIPEEARVILYVGNFLAIKQPLLLIQAHAALCQPQNAPLLILIGAGPLEAAIRQEAARLGSSAQLLIAGRKTASEIADFMRAADLLALSSANEGVPNVVLEALASGLPVVAPRVGGLPEIINEKFLGALTDPGDPRALETAMADLLSPPRDSAQIREYALKFNWPETANRYTRRLEGSLDSPSQ